MKWWGYLSIVSAFALVSYICTHLQQIRGVLGEIKTYFSVRRQKYHIKNFAFKSGEEEVFFDYLVINQAGVFAVTLHNLKGDLHHRKGRILLQGSVKRVSYLYFNPVPHDVRKVVLLNEHVEKDVDIIPVAVFPRGNDKHLRAMWITPVNELKTVFVEPCEKPLTEEQLVNTYNKLKQIRVKASRAKKRDRGFIKRKCPNCGAYLYERQDKNVFYIKCDNCAFRRDFTASILPDEDS